MQQGEVIPITGSIRPEIERERTQWANCAVQGEVIQPTGLVVSCVGLEASFGEKTCTWFTMRGKRREG